MTIQFETSKSEAVQTLLFGACISMIFQFLGWLNIAILAMIFFATLAIITAIPEKKE